MFKGFVRQGELRRWAPWAGVVLLILMAVVLETSMESVCWDDELAKAAKINEAAGCFEFWLNRYQTLLGVAAALVAGGLAYMGVQQQIRAANVQARIAQRQFAASTMEAISNRASKLRDIHRLLRAAVIDVNLAIDVHNNAITEAVELISARSEGRRLELTHNSYYMNLLSDAKDAHDRAINKLIAVREAQANSAIEKVVNTEISDHIEGASWAMSSLFELRSWTEGTIDTQGFERMINSAGRWIRFARPQFERHQYDRAVMAVPALNRSIKQLEDLLDRTILEVERG